MSYPLYLFHAPIQAAVSALFSGGSLSLHPALHCAVFFGVPLAVSATAGIALERYFLARRKSWMRSFRNPFARRKPAPESTLPAPNA